MKKQKSEKNGKFVYSVGCLTMEEAKMARIRGIPKAEKKSCLLNIRESGNILEIVEVAKRFVTKLLKPDYTPYGIFIAGKLGCGKTKLLSAIGNDLIFHGMKSLMYVTNEDMVAHFANHSDAKIKQMMACRVLLFDNVDLSVYSKWIPSIMRVLSSRKDNGKPTVMATRMSKAVCESWSGGRFMSMIKGYCKIMHLKAEDYNNVIQNEIAKTFS